MNLTKEDELYGLITNIQKYTIHDGPGIRTEIFFKGCPLKCLWCSNPEGLSPRQQIGVYPTKCIGISKCTICLKECPEGKNTPILTRDDCLLEVNEIPECTSCYRCAENCPSGAIMVWGKKMTVPELMKIILEDRSFYIKSGGRRNPFGGRGDASMGIRRTFIKRVQRCFDKHMC